MMKLVGTVVYYRPFTVYEVADEVRIALAIVCASTVLMMVFLAIARWKEGRHSATMFLLALSFNLIVEALIVVHGLGHPPVWWLIWLLWVAPIIAVLACMRAAREIRMGVWSQ